tara:strand:- start:1067 stop:2131 length:1065 start_codon:yes stop_codon:yes gene_type:complete
MSSESDSYLDLTNVGLNYRTKQVLANISFSLRRGEIGCLLGPSGCGKTSLLRAIAGFESVSSGGITLNNNSISRVGYSLSPEQRQIGMVFQDYALFPHLNVIDNIRFGLHQLPTQQANERALYFLERIGLVDKEMAMPHELSGGEQQRVALARALAPQPDLLLLDEPFSNLDVDLRESLGKEVRSLLKQTQTTAVMVTHDQHEAFAIADSIGVLRDGALLQWDSAYAIYHQPVNAFVADFVGQGVMLQGTMISLTEVKTTLGCFERKVIAGVDDLIHIGDRVKVLIRPDDIIHQDNSALKAKVIARHFRGAVFLYTLELENKEQVLALVPSHHDHAINEWIGIRLEIDHVVVFK